MLEVLLYLIHMCTGIGVPAFQPRRLPGMHLAFTHSLCLAYDHGQKDIKIHNILVNLYNGDAVYDDCREFYASQKARFVLCDFDLSVIFPPDTPPAARVCPASESDWGSYRYHPPDAADGQTVYDPFAYDVACLGGLLCELIGVCCISTLSGLLANLNH